MRLHALAFLLAAGCGGQGLSMLPPATWCSVSFSSPPALAASAADVTTGYGSGVTCTASPDAVQIERAGFMLDVAGQRVELHDVASGTDCTASAGAVRWTTTGEGEDNVFSFSCGADEIIGSAIIDR